MTLARFSRGVPMDNVTADDARMAEIRQRRLSLNTLRQLAERHGLQPEVDFCYPWSDEHGIHAIVMHNAFGEGKGPGFPVAYKLKDLEKKARKGQWTPDDDFMPMQLGSGVEKTPLYVEFLPCRLIRHDGGGRDGQLTTRPGDSTTFYALVDWQRPTIFLFRAAVDIAALKQLLGDVGQTQVFCQKADLVGVYEDLTDEDLPVCYLLIATSGEVKSGPDPYSWPE